MQALTKINDLKFQGMIDRYYAEHDGKPSSLMDTVLPANTPDKQRREALSTLAWPKDGPVAAIKALCHDPESQWRSLEVTAQDPSKTPLPKGHKRWDDFVQGRLHIKIDNALKRGTETSAKALRIDE